MSPGCGDRPIASAPSGQMIPMSFGVLLVSSFQSKSIQKPIVPIRPRSSLVVPGRPRASTSTWSFARMCMPCECLGTGRDTCHCTLWPMPWQMPLQMSWHTPWQMIWHAMLNGMACLAFIAPVGSPQHEWDVPRVGAEANAEEIRFCGQRLDRSTDVEAV